MPEGPKIQYLNTDLDLVAPESLERLAAHLESLGVFPGFVTREDDGLWYRTLETEGGDDDTEPESAIVRMLTAVESLPEDEKRIWNACTKRDFNIGYELGDKPWAFNQGLSNETLSRIAQCGATLRWTLYPYRPDEPLQCKAKS